MQGVRPCRPLRRARYAFAHAVICISVYLGQPAQRFRRGTTGGWRLAAAARTAKHKLVCVCRVSSRIGHTPAPRAPTRRSHHIIITSYHTISHHITLYITSHHITSHHITWPRHTPAPCAPTQCWPPARPWTAGSAAAFGYAYARIRKGISAYLPALALDALQRAHELTQVRRAAACQRAARDVDMYFPHGLSAPIKQNGTPLRT